MSNHYRTADLPPGRPPATAAGLYLAECEALADRRRELVAEAWDRAASRFAPDEVFVRIELQRADADLLKLAADPRAVLALADVSARLSRLEAAAAAKGVTA